MSSRTAVISRLRLEHPLPRGLTHMPDKLVLALVGGLSSSAHSDLHKQHLCSHHMVAHFLQNKLSKRLKRQLRCLLWSNFRGHTPSFCNISFSVGGVYTRKWIPRSEDHHSPFWRLANTTDVQLTLGRLGELELPSVKSHIYHRHTHDTLTKLKILVPCTDSSLSLWAAILLCWPHMAIWVDPSGEWEARIWLLVPPQAPYPVYLQVFYGTLPPVDFLSCT